MDDQYYVRVVYNGRPVVFCQNDFNFNKYYCPFSKFVETAQSTFIFPKFETNCGNEELGANFVHELHTIVSTEQRVKFYLIWLNTIFFAVVVLSVMYIRKSTNDGVQNVLNSYNQLLKEEESKRSRGMPLEKKTIDTEGSEDTDRDQNF